MTGLADVVEPGRCWQLVVPAPCAWLSANDRGHWAGQSRLADRWRRTAYVLALGAWARPGGPGPPKQMGYARLEVELHFRDRRPRDAANYHASVKPVVDALGAPFVRPPSARQPRGRSAPGLALLVDDTPAHLDGPHVSIGRLWRQVAGELAVRTGRHVAGGMTITLTDLSGDGGQEDAGT